MLLKSSTNRKTDTPTPYLDSFYPFLVQVRMCLVVIGGAISSKMEMASRNRDSRKQCVPSNNIIVGFWSLKGIFKTRQQA